MPTHPPVATPRSRVRPGPLLLPLLPSPSSLPRGNLDRVRVLAIESSCDETAAAVVVDGREMRSSVVASQVDLHAKYGGIVPEVASRQHLRQIGPVIQEALDTAGVTLDHIEAIAATRGPGLAGSLLVGYNTGKAIAYGRELPFLGTNHL